MTPKFQWLVIIYISFFTVYLFLSNFKIFYFIVFFPLLYILPYPLLPPSPSWQLPHYTYLFCNHFPYWLQASFGALQVSVPHSETSLKEQPLSLSPAGGTKNDDRTMQWHIKFQDVAHVTSFHISLAKSSSMANQCQWDTKV